MIIGGKECCEYCREEIKGEPWAILPPLDHEMPYPVCSPCCKTRFNGAWWFVIRGKPMAEARAIVDAECTPACAKWKADRLQAITGERGERIMSFYNMLHGEQPLADGLLTALGISRGDIARYRDCYPGENGTIVVFCRMGGGNRGEANDATDGWCNEEQCAPDCLDLFWAKIRQHPLYVRDADDEYDNTYALITFRCPEGVSLDGAQVPPSFAERSAAVLEAMRGA